MTLKVDVLLLILCLLLIATLTAFVSGFIPYPFGIMILVIFILVRLSERRH
jgi:hypothetical protein